MGKFFLLSAAAENGAENNMLPFIILGGAIAAVLVVFLCIWVFNRAKKKKNSDYAESVKIADGVRYSKDESVTKDGEMNVSHAMGDFILQRGTEYTAKKNGALMPGTYTVLSTNDESAEFKIRLGGYVQTCKHGDVIVLADGEQVCAVSANVILR